MEHREKDVFTAAKDIVEKGTAKDCAFHADDHASYIVDLAEPSPSTKRPACC